MCSGPLSSEKYLIHYVLYIRFISSKHKNNSLPQIIIIAIKLYNFKIDYLIKEKCYEFLMYAKASIKRFQCDKTCISTSQKKTLFNEFSKAICSPLQNIIHQLKCVRDRSIFCILLMIVKLLDYFPFRNPCF